MKTFLRILLLAALGGLGFWLWMILFPSPEKVVLKKIASLAATATFSADASNITRAGKAGKLIGFFAVDAQIIFDAPGQTARTLSGRDEIRAAALAGFGGMPALQVRFLDVSVRIGADRQTADVSCTARANAGDRQDFGVQEMHFQLKQLDGDWLITRAETVKTLS